jgi:hypothetical protein
VSAPPEKLILKDPGWVSDLEDRSPPENSCQSPTPKPFGEAIVSEYPFYIFEKDQNFLEILRFGEGDSFKTLRLAQGPATDERRLQNLVQKSLDGYPSDESFVFYCKDGGEINCVVNGHITSVEGVPACKLLLLPFSFDSGDCVLQSKILDESLSGTDSSSLEGYRVCSIDDSLRELLGFRPDDIVRVSPSSFFSF